MTTYGGMLVRTTFAVLGACCLIALAGCTADERDADADTGADAAAIASSPAVITTLPLRALDATESRDFVAERIEQVRFRFEVPDSSCATLTPGEACAALQNVGPVGDVVEIVNGIANTTGYPRIDRVSFPEDPDDSPTVTLLDDVSLVVPPDDPTLATNTYTAGARFLEAWEGMVEDCSVVSTNCATPWTELLAASDSLLALDARWDGTASP